MPGSYQVTIGEITFNVVYGSDVSSAQAADFRNALINVGHFDKIRAGFTNTDGSISTIDINLSNSAPNNPAGTNPVLQADSSGTYKAQSIQIDFDLQGISNARYQDPGGNFHESNVRSAIANEFGHTIGIINPTYPVDSITGTNPTYGKNVSNFGTPDPAAQNASEKFSRETENLFHLYGDEPLRDVNAPTSHDLNGSNLDNIFPPIEDWVDSFLDSRGFGDVDVSNFDFSNFFNLGDIFGALGGWLGNLFNLGGFGDGNQGPNGGYDDGAGDGSGNPSDPNDPPLPPPDKPPLPVPPPEKKPSPLVLDLDGDGVELHTLGTYGTYFDLKNSGQAVLTGWVHPDDGLLAYDVNQNGRIDSLSELFGTQTTDGFSVLRGLDSNNDGVINSSDAEFGSLLVWRDLNSDAYSQNSELYSLDEFDITEIRLDADRINATEINGNVVTHESTFIINGVEQLIVDVWFDYDSVLTRNSAEYTFDLRTGFLPTLRGYGEIKDLHIAASIDNGSSSSTLIEQLLSFSDGRTFAASITDWNDTQQLVEALLLRWSGVDEISPTSRGSYVDARYLAFYEAYKGEDFDQYGRANPLPEAGQFVNAFFNFIVISETMQLIAQTSGVEIYEDVKYDIYSGKLVGDFSLLQTGLEAIKDEAMSAVDPASVWARFAQFVGYTKGFDNLTISEIASLDAAVLATSDPGLTDWEDVISLMSASLGTIIDSSDDWGSFELFFDNSFVGTNGDDVVQDTGIGAFINSKLRGLDGNDILQGLSGHDRLEGGNGNDRLEGGDGDDYLLGGNGDDIYYYTAGNDTVGEVDGSGNDTLLIASSTGFTQVNLVDIFRYDDDLLLRFSNNDIVSIEGYAISGQEIEEIKFEVNNYVIDLTALTQQKFYGTEYDDHLTATGTSIQTLLVYGYSGNDTLIADGGIASFYGGDGYDTLVGDYLNDTLNGGNQDDYLSGAGGNDTLYGDAGRDTLNGGEGNDRLTGGTGGDTYIFGRGYDHDTIFDGAVTSLGSNIDVDRLVFESDVLTTDILVQKGIGKDDIKLVISDTGDSVTLERQTARTAYGSNTYEVEKVVFADGTVWTTGDMQQTYLDTVATSGNDTIVAFMRNDVIEGLAGNDRLEGRGGSDTYIFGAGFGDDVVSDNAELVTWDTPDTIQFTGTWLQSDFTFAKVGNDLVIDSIATSDKITVEKFYTSSGIYRVENFVFSDNSSLSYTDIFTMTVPGALIVGTSAGETLNGTSGNNRIEGREGNDTLKGGDGDDILVGEDGDDNLQGGAHNDIYIAGPGNDTITETSGTDLVEFGAGIIIDDLEIYRTAGEDLIIEWMGNSITVDKQFLDIPSDRRVESLLFSDASTLDLINRSYVTKGTSSSETIYGMASTVFGLNDTIYGYGGNDILRGDYGGATGNDTLDGGDGNDTLEGGRGDDTYVHSGGNDTIEDVYQSTSGAGIDTIQFGSGITLADLTMYRSGSSLIIDVSDGSKITVIGQHLGANSKTIESLSFFGGSTFTFSSTQQIEYRGTSGNDTMSGNGGNSSIDDTMYGYAGNDTMTGNTGNDTIFGGDGADTINGNAGNDFIYGDDGDDTLHGDDGDDLIVGGAGNDTINGNNNNDSIDGGDGADIINGGSGNDAIVGGDGNDSITGGAGDDNLAGNDGDDVIYETFSGTDVIDGGAGNDTLDYSAAGSYRITINLLTGTQSDTHSTASSDTISNIENVIGTAGNDLITGSNVDNILQGGSGTDTIYGKDGNDTIKGDANNDTLYGENGDDIIYGGAGLDTMYGGAGLDTFVFEAASAYSNIDVIKDFSLSDGDRINLHDLLSSYDPLTQLITDYVQITTSGSNSILKIDRDGTGSTYNLTQVATIEGITGLTDEAALVTSGNIVV